MVRADEAAGAAPGSHIGAELQTEETPDLVVQFIGAVFSGLDTFQIGLRQMIFIIDVRRAGEQAVRPGAIFKVQSVVHRLIGVVASAPVADHHAVEAPLPLQNIHQDALVVAEVLIIIKVVCAHDRPGTTFGDSRLECGQIDLVKRSVIHVHIHGVTVDLVVIQREMLDADGHILALDALNVGHYHGRGKEGVFPHILEVAPAEGMAEDVDTGAEQHRLLAVEGFFCDALAIEAGHLRIPAGRQAGQGRICSAGIIGPASLAPLVPKHFGTDAVRAVGAPYFRNPEARHTGRAEFALRVCHRYLLFQSNLGKEFVYLFFDVRRFLGAGRGKHQSGNQEQVFFHIPQI